MSSKPKKRDYQASEAEKLAASVGLAQYQNFKQKYDPLLKQLRDQSTTTQITDTLRDRSAADTAQVLTSAGGYRQARSVDDAADYTQGYLSQLGGATAEGGQMENQVQSNVLATASQQGDAGAVGLSEIARTQTRTDLERMANRQQVRNARWSAIANTGSAFIGQGIQNKMTGGTFFTPLDQRPGTAAKPNPNYQKPILLKDRFRLFS